MSLRRTVKVDRQAGIQVDGTDSQIQRIIMHPEKNRVQYPPGKNLRAGLTAFARQTCTGDIGALAQITGELKTKLCA